MTESNTRRLGDHVYEALITMIRSQKLEEGARLPPEKDMAIQFGVSRPIIRETLSRLRDEGLVVSRRGSGSYIGKPTDEALTPSAGTPQPINSFELIQKCYEFRAILEGEACYLAALNRTDAQLREIEDHCHHLADAVQKKHLGSEVDFEFHSAIARATGNPFFETVLASMRSQIEFTIEIARTLSLNRAEERMVSVQNEHELVFEPIRQKDAEGARSAMRAHLTTTLVRIFRGPDQQ